MSCSFGYSSVGAIPTKEQMDKRAQNLHEQNKKEVERLQKQIDEYNEKHKEPA